MINESLKSVRNGMVAAFALVVVWTLAFPLTVAELKMRQAAEDLTSWLVLRSKFVDGYVDEPNLHTFHERFVGHQPATGASIDSELKEPPLARADLRPGGDNSPTPQRLTLAVLWPGEKSDVRVLLRARTVEGPYEVFEVHTDARFLPFDRYDVAIDKRAGCRDCIEVLGRQDWAEQPRLLQAVFNTQNQPKEWDYIRSRLWPGDTEVPEATSLHQHDSVVAGFVKDALNTSHAVWGVSVDAGLFFVAPGVLLGAQAFLLLAAVFALLSASDVQAREPWIMAIATRSPRRRTLEAVLLAISTVWFLMPLAVGVAQVAAAIELHPFERACYWLGVAGLLFSTAVNAVILHQLRRVRRT